MDYYKILDFYTEPFSNSPDPEFFYGSSNHLDCLQKLEISIRLRRGLCVVLGQVGAGKTTICRKLIFDLQDDPEIETCLVMDPSFMGPLEMLGHLNRIIRNPGPEERPPSTESGYKELLKNHLFEQVAQKKRNVVLIVDEGQKISSSCLEVLRELLNFETNDHKLLQIIIFAQNEFINTLKAHQNFTDRINLLCRVNPLNLKETGQLINYRLQKASDYGSRRRPRLKFTSGALRAVHFLTSGHPRRIMNLCHRVVMLAIIKNRYRVTASMVKKARQGLPDARQGWFGSNLPWVAAGASAGLILALSILFLVPALTDFDAGEFLTREKAGQKSHPYSVRMNLEPVSEVEAGDLMVRQNLNSSQEAMDSSGASADDPAPGNVLPDHAKTDQKSPAPWPEEFGLIRVNRHENLWNMVERVYGQAAERLMNRMAAANPHIKDIHNLYEGLAVYFPVNGFRPPEAVESWWVVLGSYPDLKRAYASLLGADSKRLRILAFSRDEKNIVYTAAWRRSFAAEKDALEALDKMPARIKAKARLINLDEGDIVFY
ncbi:MAG: AAA family ATPase [Desulfonatronovibrio sp.]